VNARVEEIVMYEACPGCAMPIIFEDGVDHISDGNGIWHRRCFFNKFAFR